MAGRFVPNRAGFTQYLKSNDAFRAVDRVAEKIETRARTSAPVETPESARAHRRNLGRFRGSIHRRKEMRPSRVISQVVANMDEAEIIEHRFRTLGRAAY